MQIIVRTPTGLSFILDVMPNHTIETLKNMIQDIYGFPYKQQTIQFNGFTLSDDNKTLHDYHITEDTIVQLVLRILI